MVLGGFGRFVFWIRDLAQSRSRIVAFTLRGCIALARDCLNDRGARPNTVEHSIRLPEDSNLGVVRSIHATLPAQRSFLVGDRRDGFAKRAPANFSLLSDPDCLRDRGFTSLHSELATRNALGPRNCARAQPDFACVVLRLDLAGCSVAKSVCMERPLDHTFFLLLVLGRAALWFAMARGAVVARPHHCTGPGRFSYAGRAKKGDGRNDLTASSKSFGSAASKLFHSPVPGC